MAQQTTGSAFSTLFRGQRQKFAWSVVSYDSVNRTSTIKWTLSTWADNTASPTYFVCQKTQVLDIYYNGEYHRVLNMSQTYKNSKGTIYNGFVDPNSYLDKNYRNKEYWDKNGDYTGIQRWVKILGVNWLSGTFVLKHDQAGNARFGVTGMFHWFDQGDRPLNMTWFDVTSIGREQYTINFSSDKTATDVPQPITKEYGIDVKLPIKTPTYKGYSFKGWKDPNTGLIYNAGDTYSEDGNVTLQAVWELNNYFITLDLDGGTYLGSGEITTLETRPADSYNYLGSNVFEIPYGTVITLPIKGMLKTGYNLKKWSDGTPTSYVEYLVESSVTLTPNWENETYTIRLYDTVTNTVVKTIQLTYDKYIEGKIGYNKPGYDLLGWSLEPIQPVTMEESTPSSIYVRFNVDGNQNDKYYQPNELGYTKHTSVTDKLYAVYRYQTSTYVRHNGEWKLALPYIRVNGEWKLMLPEIRNNGNWKL